jgi:hypothetical protein
VLSDVWIIGNSLGDLLEVTSAKPGSSVTSYTFEIPGLGAFFRETPGRSCAPAV